MPGKQINEQGFRNGRATGFCNRISGWMPNGKNRDREQRFWNQGTNPVQGRRKNKARIRQDQIQEDT